MNNQCSRMKLVLEKQTFLKMYTMALMQDVMFFLQLSAILEKEWQKQQMIKKFKKFKKRIHQYRKRLSKKKRQHQAYSHAENDLQTYSLFSMHQARYVLEMGYTY